MSGIMHQACASAARSRQATASSILALSIHAPTSNQPRASFLTLSGLLVCFLISLNATLPLQAEPLADLDDDVVQWVGSGTNAAYLIIDFNDSSTIDAEFVFGVLYGDAVNTATLGLELLHTVADATRLTFHDAGGGFVDRITYGPFDGDATQSYPPTWTFFDSPDLGQTFTSPWVGVAAYEVLPGSTIAFSFTKGEWPGLAPNGPRVTSAEFALMEDVVEWTGEGSNRTYFVLDFNDSSTIDAEFVFGLSYGDEITTSIVGIEVMEQIATQTAMAYRAPDEGYGPFMNYIQYGPDYIGDASQSYPPTWSYWVSYDYSQTYATTFEGVGSLAVYPGDVIAFRFTDGEWPGPPPNGPRSLAVQTFPLTAAQGHWRLYRK